MHAGDVFLVKQLCGGVVEFGAARDGKFFEKAGDLVVGFGHALERLQIELKTVVVVVVHLVHCCHQSEDVEETLLDGAKGLVGVSGAVRAEVVLRWTGR